MSQKLLINVVARVAIISFYAAQVDSIYETLKGRYPNINVNTVDGFQGGENDIVIVSCVRANFEKQIGFLKDFRRLNVAITRAKFSLIILGNKATLMRSDIAELVADADARKLLYTEEVLQKLIPQKPKKPAYSTKTIASRKKADNKTKLCRYYMSNPSSCTKGADCIFVHGENELRSRSFSHRQSNSFKK